MFEKKSCYYDVHKNEWYHINKLTIDNGVFMEVESGKSTYSSDYNTYILPGFIDAHCHITETPYCIEYSEEIYNANYEELTERATMNLLCAQQAGITSVKDLGGRLFASIDIKNRLCERDDIPRIFTSGCYFTKPKGHGSGRGAVVLYDIDSFKRYLNHLVDAGIKFVKILHGENGFSLSELEKIIDWSHIKGMTVSTHAYTNNHAYEALMAGTDILEHAGNYSQLILEKIRSQGTIIVPTYVSAWDSTKENCAGIGDDVTIDILTQWFQGEKMVIPKLFEMGIDVALGTDAGFPDTPFDSLHREINLLNSDFNIPIEKILYAAYITTPKTIKMHNKLGQIRKGFFADFLCYTENPLDNIKVLKRPSQVWIRGKRVYSNE